MVGGEFAGRQRGVEALGPLVGLVEVGEVGVDAADHDVACALVRLEPHDSLLQPLEPLAGVGVADGWFDLFEQ